MGGGASIQVSLSIQSTQDNVTNATHVNVTGVNASQAASGISADLVSGSGTWRLMGLSSYL